MKERSDQVCKSLFSAGQVQFLSVLCRPGPFLILAFLLISCATPKAISTLQGYKEVIPVDSRILILQPRLKFEGLRDEAVLDPSNFSGTSIAAGLDTAARNAIAGSKYRVAEIEVMDGPEIVDLCSRLQALSSMLVVGGLNDEVDMILQRLSALDQNLVVLSHFLYAKVGPGGYWNPLSGAIGSSMSTTRLQVSLICCNKRRVVWKNEVLLRKLPQVDDSKYAEALQLLYANFPGEEED